MGHVIIPSATRFSEQTVYCDMDGSSELLMDSALKTVGIANVWTLAYWIWFDADTAALDYIFDCRRTDNNVNCIAAYVSWNSDNLLGFFNAGSDGATIKNYLYSVPATGQWILHVFTWDGTNVFFYKDGTLEASSSKDTDDSGTMTDTARGISLGYSIRWSAYHMDGRLHSVAMWNTAFDQANVTALYNGGDSDFNLLRSSGNYNQSTALKHWWRVGHDSSDIGEDYGKHTNLFDVMDNAANISAADIATGNPGA